jgi:hypothetical protein
MLATSLAEIKQFSTTERIQSEAEAEISEAFRWYEDKHEGLGSEFKPLHVRPNNTLRLMSPRPVRVRLALPGGVTILAPARRKVTYLATGLRSLPFMAETDKIDPLIYQCDSPPTRT